MTVMVLRTPFIGDPIHPHTPPAPHPQVLPPLYPGLHRVHPDPSLSRMLRTARRRYLLQGVQNAHINAYALAKAGVSQLARNLAVQWGPQSIRTNAIAPGLIRTELSEPLLSDQEFMRKRLQMTPLRRVGELEEIGAAARFLASPAGAFVNGQTLVIDGGTCITDGR